MASTKRKKSKTNKQAAESKEPKSSKAKEGKAKKKKAKQPESLALPVSYFAREKPGLTFSTGSTVLNCALGGGWPLERMFNVVGDKSTGKTLIMIEACANFIRKYQGDCDVYYIETESAFDMEYAQALGMPVHQIQFPNEDDESAIRTVDALELFFEKVLEKTRRPTLVIVDSYDALSSEAELVIDPEKGTYGMDKAKIGTRIFRKLNSRLSSAQVTVGIVSQTRAKVDVRFGKKVQRSGGKCLDFYATHIVWLAHIGYLTKQRESIKRAYGIQVEAAVEKNKLGMPHRKAKFPVHFGYGIEDVVSMIDFLAEHNGLHLCMEESTKDARLKAAKELRQNVDDISDKEYRDWHKRLVHATKERWQAVETLFTATRSKYAD